MPTPSLHALIANMIPEEALIDKLEEALQQYRLMPPDQRNSDPLIAVCSILCEKKLIEQMGGLDKFADENES